MKETNVPSIPTVIPIVGTAVPSTLAEHLEPKVPLATVVSMQSIDTSATGSSTTQVHQAGKAADIVKAMEEMSLKNNEINKLKNTIQTLESSNMNALITLKGHEQREKRLEE